MKRLMIMISMVAFVFFSTQAFCADRADISKNVDEIVAAIDGGKNAASYAPNAYTPYIFIIEIDGKVIIHPGMAGKDLKIEAMPIYDAIKAATTLGSWVKYEWSGKEKNTYAKRTKNNLIVGSGY